VRGDELILQVKNFRRHLLLPRRLEGLTVRKARLAGDTFIVTFDPPKRSAEGGT
jgi:hypothetical protein